MSNDDQKIAELRTEWVNFKLSEKIAADNRRKIEDELVKLLEVPESLDGTQTFDFADGSKMKIVGRMNRKVDPEKLRDLAAEHGVHVVSEKPMATRYNDGLRMVQACDEAGVRLFVVKQNRE